MVNMDILSFIRRLVPHRRDKEALGLKGLVEWRHWDKEGNLKDIGKSFNVILNEGKAYTAGLLCGDVSGAYDSLALGTSDTSASASDTGLISETHRATATTSRVTTTVSNDTAQWVHTFSFSDSYALREVGVCRGSSDDFLTRANITINVESGDKVQITYKVQVQ